MEDDIRKKPSGKKRKSKWPVFLLADAALLVIAAVMLLLLRRERIGLFAESPGESAGSDALLYETEASWTPASEKAAADAKNASLAEEAPGYFKPHCLPDTEPSGMIASQEIIDGDELLTDPSEYHPWYNMNFGTGSAYTDVDGIITFRGDSFRNSPACGSAGLEKCTIEGIWSRDTGGLTYQNASWSGSGWTGQPLMERWPKSVRRHMNMYDWAKEKDDLVEVIYACMDGYVYFLDLESGEPTRDSLYLGWTFKGAGALDPRGYPVLYLGAGYDSYEGTSRVFFVNLLDCSVLYTFGDEDPYSLRGRLSFFDSSALVDAASDTLIYPGENGILYLIHLNTKYDPAAGTLSMEPDHTVRWRYNTFRNDGASYWLGMEDSAAVYQGYLFIADNGGHLMCLDLNTLKLVWVQDILDDSNSTPVLSVEEGRLYLYVSTSFHLGWRSSLSAPVPVWKIDAQTGGIVWHTDFECYSEEGVSGGVQSTIASGKNALSDYIYVTVARTGGESMGVLACLDKKTGKTVWEHESVYAWSSPVCVYRKDGTGVVIYCSCDGSMYMLDGITGEEKSRFSLSNGAIEASPAVYGDIAVVGTRACKIWGLKLN